MAYLPSSSPLHEVADYLIIFNVTFLLMIILLLNFSWQIKCKCLQTICLELNTVSGKDTKGKKGYVIVCKHLC